MDDKLLHSERMRLARGEVPDILCYDELPEDLRTRIVLIWREAVGYPIFSTFTGMHSRDTVNFWEHAKGILLEKRGVFRLVPQPVRDEEEVALYFLREDDVELALDVVELVLGLLRWKDHTAAQGAIERINRCFLESGVGFQYEGEQIVRVDSRYLHHEATRPALALLADQAFVGASQEFLAAHEHYRHGRFKESVNEALKAFESTMKAICKRRTWGYPSGAAARALLSVLYEKELIPRYLQSQFTALRSVLESGLPTVRSKTSAHGQGAEINEMPGHLAAYALHLAASNIVFLMEADKAWKPATAS